MSCDSRLLCVSVPDDPSPLHRGEFTLSSSCHFSLLLLLSVELQTAPKETPGQLERELDGPALPPSGREGKGREEMRKEEGREDLVGVGTGGKRRGGVLGRERRPTLE